MELIGQEVSQDAEIEIPEPIRDVYRLWRPTPLYRAHRLEQALGTRSRIFYKYEGVSPAGSHKPNTAVAQAYYVKQDGRNADRDGDRRRPVGQRDRAREPAVRARVQGLHGQGLVRAEAVPPLDDADLGRRGRREPVRGHERRPRRSSPSIPIRRAASASRSPRRWRTPRRATTPRTRSAASSTTC